MRLKFYMIKYILRYGFVSCRIKYILNVTREIDNFFIGMFHYCNVRLYDQEDSELMKHWLKTYKFINKAR